MTLVEYVRFGVAHGTWALRELIACAETLPAAKTEEDLSVGPGSLRVNIAHTVEAMLFFADCFAGRVYAEPPDFQSRSSSLAGLRALADHAGAALRRSMIEACERGLPASIAWPGTDAPSMPAAAAVAQVFDHATLHRAQAVNMLKRLGVRPVPDLDPMTFQSTGLPW